MLWNNYFPYDKPREQQTRSIEKVLEEFKNGKRYAVVECGTGVGKSAIGLTIARYLNNNSEFELEKNRGAYFLTTQRVLQDQYYKDFKKTGIVSLSSSSNYLCSKSNSGETCKDIATLLRTSNYPKKFEGCKFDCCYKRTKREFIEGQLGITNFAYFLTEINYSGKITPKRVLVIDEAHNLENELTRFVEISVSQYFSEKILKLKVPELKTQFQTFNWIKGTYFTKLKSKIDHIEKQIDKLGLSSKIKDFKNLTNQFEMLKSHKGKIERFISLYDKENWVFDIIENDKRYKKFSFRPIDISNYSHEYLFNHADYVVFMSATIIHHEGFIETIGIDPDKTVIVKEKSPFDPEKRPLIYSPSGHMSMKNINSTLPVMTKAIKEILKEHKDAKGIIHAHSIKVAKYLTQNIKDPRLILAYGADREKMLEKHIQSKRPTVLISPSMSEGVDLKGDLSKFQVLCKVPFPYLGDKACRKKMNKWKWWYDAQTVRTIVQSIGRSIRSENDEAITYILDADWKRIKGKAKHMFPVDFFDNYHEF